MIAVSHTTEWSWWPCYFAKEISECSISWLITVISCKETEEAVQVVNVEHFLDHSVDLLHWQCSLSYWSEKLFYVQLHMPRTATSVWLENAEFLAASASGIQAQRKGPCEGLALLHTP